MDDTKNHEPMTRTGGNFMEPNCPNLWCRSLDSVKWSGPGEYGYLIEPNMVKRPFQVQQHEEL
jgi:hypothetical protein